MRPLLRPRRRDRRRLPGAAGRGARRARRRGRRRGEPNCGPPRSTWRPASRIRRSTSARSPRPSAASRSRSRCFRPPTTAARRRRSAPPSGSARRSAPDSPMTVGVVAGHNFNAASSTVLRGRRRALSRYDSVEANKTQLQRTNDVTNMIQSFVTGLQSRPLSGSSACRGSSAAAASDATKNSGGSSAVPWVLGAIGVLGAGGVGAWRGQPAPAPAEGDGGPPRRGALALRPARCRRAEPRPR